MRFGSYPCFVGLFDSHRFVCYSSSFPSGLLDSFMASPYGKLFNRNELRGELQLLYQDKSLSQPPDQLIVTIDKDGLESAFPEVYRALKLILTQPMTTASAERSVSCLKHMKNYLRSTMLQERLSNLAIISLEKELAQGIPEAMIIDKFAAKTNRRIELHYR